LAVIAHRPTFTEKVTVRPIFLSAALALVSVASAQITAPTPESTLNDAFANLYALRDYRVTVTGNEWYGETPTPFDVTLTWHQLGEGDTRSLKLAMVKRIAGNPVLEIRAQGDRLLSYDYQAHTYTTTRYHRVADPSQPNLRANGYLNGMLGAFVRALPSAGPEAYLGLLLQQAMGDPVVAGSISVAPQHYRRWLPTQEPVLLTSRTDLLQPTPPSPPDTYADPLLATRTYLDTPDDEVEHVLYNQTGLKSLVFRVRNYSTLDAIFFAERSRRGNRDRLVEWTMAFEAVSDNVQDPNYEFRFAPYTDLRGWKPLVAPRG
jgi:hypothetical protein